ncbi:AAA family ATPase [Mycobacterium riyadhense]|uniref:AAA family ATPase n=1 Tax=Mycobacterium riyadhense TaxID=486698 RepID=UPI00195280F8|nr:AAA family ATPase [Mycobacterium riyadhense]
MTIQAQPSDNGECETPKPDLRVVSGADEFVAYALAWREAGYPPLILGGDNGKRLLVRHVTGYSPDDATEADIRSWPNRFQRHGEVNLGIRCPAGIISIDVDAYDGKRGLATLAECETAWGPLPPTWITTAREDGSGHRWYRVPPGWCGHDPKAQDGSDGHIEVIQRHQRYAAVPPSGHANGSDYRLYGPGGEEIAPGILPPPSRLPELPQAWLDGLGSTTRARGGRIAPAEVGAWLDSTGGEDYPHGLGQVLTMVDNRLSEGVNRHKAMFSALCLALKEARAGGYSARRAHDDLKRKWRNIIRDPDDGSHNEAEFGAMVPAAIAAAEADDSEKRWLRMRRNYGEDTRENPDVNGVLSRVRSENKTAVALASPSEDDRDSNQVDRAATTCLADIAPTTVNWLWKGWVPLGKVSILEGESDVGKSTVTLAWASIVSNGSRWPATVMNGKKLYSQHDPAGVVLVGVEDSNDDTVVPRLIAAGADLNRVHTLNRPVDDDGNPKPFTIPADISWLRKAIVEADAKLVVIDPITACLPEDARHGVDSSIRRILMFLVELARETASAIVLIRHFNKAQGMSAKNRGGGSVAYSALVRSVLSAGRLKEDHDSGATFAIARAIGNLSKPPESVGYKIEDAPDLSSLPKPEDDELRVSVVKWCGAVGITADQLVGADGAKIGDARKTAPVRDDAEAALKELLSNGPMKMNEVVAEAMRIAGCSNGTVKQAAKNLEIIKKSIYLNGKIDHWTWELPPTVFKVKHMKTNED